VDLESNGRKNRSERCRSEEEWKDVNEVTGRDCVGLVVSLDSGDILGNERRGGRGESSGFIWIGRWTTRSRSRSWSLESVGSVPPPSRAFRRASSSHRVRWTHMTEAVVRKEDPTERSESSSASLASRPSRLPS
jgi:hypothetical protein